MALIKARFKVMKRNYVSEGWVSPAGFIGFVRGLEKSGLNINVINTIETLSDDKYYIIDVEMEEKHFKMAKGQAESYCEVVVERCE